MSEPGPGNRWTMTDLAVLLLRHGYLAVGRARPGPAPGAEAFRTRLLGRPALVVRSEEGAAAFYDEGLVARHGAVPAPLAHLLFGRGAVHLLDGEAHRGRKEWFLRQLADPRLDSLVDDAARRLGAAADGWGQGTVPVFADLVQVYGAAALAWTGCEPSLAEMRRVSTELARIVDGFGGAGRAYPRAWLARRRTDRWFTTRVREVRAGSRAAPPGSALAAVAGSDLDDDVAAVELGNLVRPTVAVAWLGTFAAHRLAARPDHGHALVAPRTGPGHVAFAQEVRRTAPFVPLLAGRVLREGTVGGRHVRPGDRLVLDVRGANLDPERWEAPGEFRPERFHGHEPGPYELIPQGGGQPRGHRCPGEPLTVRLLAETVRVLAAAALSSDGEDRVDETRIPTLPRNGLRARRTVG